MAIRTRSRSRGRSGWCPPPGVPSAQDPARALTLSPELAELDRIGRDLPSLLQDRGFRALASRIEIPEWPEDRPGEETLPQLRLYYLRSGSSLPLTSTR